MMQEHFVLVFATAMAAVVPISHYIGNAVGALASRTTPALGALMNGGNV